MTVRMPAILSIGGSDSSSGAGIQADIRTASQLGVYALTAVTTVTSQRPDRFISSEAVSIDILKSQILSALTCEPLAIKIGMLPSEEHIRAVSYCLAEVAKNIPIVIDPVLAPTAGNHFIEDKASFTKALVEYLFPLAYLVTPNLPESILLCSLLNTQGKVSFANLPSPPYDMQLASKELVKLYRNTSFLLKGGHSDIQWSGSDTIKDLYIPRNNFEDFKIEEITHARVNTTNTHGTGCTLSTTIASLLAHGFTLRQSIRIAVRIMSYWLNHYRNQNNGAACGIEPIVSNSKINKLIKDEVLSK